MAFVGEVALFAFGGKSENDPNVKKLRQAGWIACEGQSVDQAGPRGLPLLFEAIGISWGSLDPKNVFNVPDLRGIFIRGWDHGAGRDPSAGSRLPSGPNGATGDNVGTFQDHQLGKHSHAQTAFDHLLQSAFDSRAPRETWGGQASRATGEAGGDETRPKNAYLMFCTFTGTAPLPAGIKFFR